MDENEIDDPGYRFSKKLKWGQLEVEAVGGLVYGVGLAVTVEKSPFYYGLFQIRLMILCLFFDVAFFWGEEPLVLDDGEPVGY